MSTQTGLLAEVATACRVHGLLRPGAKVLVAVSAGADSTALAWLLAHLGEQGIPLALTLGHVDHGWRGPEEARWDRETVEALARRLGAEAVVAGPPRRPVASEDAARRWRYQVLRRLAEAGGLDHVATGHHLGDQAETVLMRLDRRSGRVGLRGIPRRRPLGPGGRIQVVRPLLDVDPTRLRALLLEEAIPWREDATNQDPTRDRARARRRLRILDAQGSAATRRLAALARRLDKRLARREARLEADLAGALDPLPCPRAVGVPRDLLLDLGAADLDLALRHLGARVGADREGPFFTRRHLGIVQTLLRSGGALDLPRGTRILVTGPLAWLSTPADPESHPAPDLTREDVASDAFDLAAFLGGREPWHAALDATKLGDRPQLRRVKAEDTFVPWSREDGHATRVLPFLAKQHVPAELRKEQLVVEAEGRVAWVVGRRVDARHAVSPSTGRVALLRVGFGS